MWFTGWLLIILKTGETKRLCMILCWMVFNDLRKSKEIFLFVFQMYSLKSMQTRFDIFFPHWHLLLHILHEIMQIYKETKISEWLHHVYLYLSLLCRSNLSLSLGLSVPRSFICKPLSLLINYWWQIVELLANQKLLWKNGEVVGGGVNHCQAIKGQRRWCVMGYSMH